MKTLAQHNAERLEAIEEAHRSQHLAGIACDECGLEMHYPDNTVLASNPPKRRVDCPNCGHSGHAL